MSFRNADHLPDGVTTKVVYVAEDGAEFSSIDGALWRNEENRKAEAGTVALLRGASVYAAALEAGWSKPDEILKQITAETPLIISFWQCQDNPGYRVSRFMRYGVYAHGDAGSWSGPYGGHVTPSDLVRYVRDTLAKHPELTVEAQS